MIPMIKSQPVMAQGNFGMQFSNPCEGNFMFPCDLLMLGESLHNNHHNNPKANFSDKWYEFDPVYPVIRILNKIGVIKLRK